MKRLKSPKRAIASSDAVNPSWHQSNEEVVDGGFNSLLGEEQSPSLNPRSYIPSPLNSPAAARRLTHKLSNSLCKTTTMSFGQHPMTALSRKKRQHQQQQQPAFGPGGVQQSAGNSSCSSSRPPPPQLPQLEQLQLLSPASRDHIDKPLSPRHLEDLASSFAVNGSSDDARLSGSGGGGGHISHGESTSQHRSGGSFFTALSSLFGGGGGGGSNGTSSLSSSSAGGFCGKTLQSKRNCFIVDSTKSRESNYLQNQNYVEVEEELHKFGDVGRIANRYQNDRWDTWTSMGEDVNNYEEIHLDEDDLDEEEEEDDEEEDDEDNDHYYDEQAAAAAAAAAANNSSRRRAAAANHDNEDVDSSSSDEFLELPLNDITICSKRRQK